MIEFDGVKVVLTDSIPEAPKPENLPEASRPEKVVEDAGNWPELFGSDGLPRFNGEKQ